MKKGAIFGLDARIALAIFGALSVISGAALYSAIQQSKTVSLLATMEEAGKAYYAYYLDTGVELPYYDTSGNMWDVSASELISSSKTNWQGPYLPNEISSDPKTLSISGFDVLFFMRATDDAWSSSAAGELPDATCDLVANANKGCFVWATIKHSNKMLSIATALDLYVDGSSTPDTGKVRVISDDFVVLQVGLSQINN